MPHFTVRTHEAEQKGDYVREYVVRATSKVEAAAKVLGLLGPGIEIQDIQPHREVRNGIVASRTLGRVGQTAEATGPTLDVWGESEGEL